MRISLMAAAVIALAASVAGPVAAAPAYPQTPKKPVVDTYQSTEVTDDYRWLEDGSDPAVREWSLAQLKVARAYLDPLPQLAALKRKLADLYRTAPHRYYDFHQVRGALFAMKNQPPRDQPVLVMMKDVGDVAHERVIFDPNAKDTKLSIDFYVPSIDGHYVALSLSEVVVQFVHRYGATQLTTRQATPPLHFTCVLHCP